MPRQPQRNSNRLSFRRYTPVQMYLKLKEFKDNRTWTLSAGQLFTKVDLEYMTEAEFDERYMYSLPSILTANPNNPNKLNNWSL